MKKILIVSFFFPPYNTIASKRWGFMSKYLKDYGYEAYVITSNQNGSLPVYISEKKIFRIGGAEENLYTRMSVSRRLIGKTVSILPFDLRSVSRESLYWYWLVRDCIDEIKQTIPKPDIIVGSFGPVSDLYVANLLSKKWNVPWIADIRDYIADFGKKNHKLKSLDVFLEKKLLSRASGITVVSSSIRERLKSRYPHKKIAIVYNGWENDHAMKPQKLKKNEREFSQKYFYYAGNIYKHQLPCVELIAETYASLKADDIDYPQFVFRKARENEVWIEAEKIVQKWKMQDKILFLGGVNSDDAQEEASTSCGNFVFGKLNDVEKMSIDIPAKTFELMPLRRPIYVVDMGNSELAEIIKETKCGGIVNSISQMKRVIKDPQVKYGAQGIERYTRKNQTSIVCGFIDEILFHVN